MEMLEGLLLLSPAKYIHIFAMSAKYIFST